MTRAGNKLLHILLIDDNSLTSLLVLRFSTYLGHKVLFADRPKQLDDLEQHFDLILINLECSFHDYWITECIRGLNRDIPVISYIPDFLIKDFNRAERSVIPKPVHDGWMLNSKLFQFINASEPLSTTLL